MSGLFSDAYLDGSYLDANEDIGNDEFPDMHDIIDYDRASPDPDGSRALSPPSTSRDALSGIYQLLPGRAQSQRRDIPIDTPDVFSEFIDDDVVSDDDDDDGLFADGLLDADAESEDEVPEEGEDVAQTQGKWKIDHSSGDHRLNGRSRVAQIT